MNTGSKNFTEKSVL